MPNSNRQSGAVGPFWFFRDHERIRLIGQPCALADAETYGDFLTSPDGHYDIWTRWRAGNAPDGLTNIVHEFEYEEIPRGRVVYNFVQNQFILYGDKQIFAHNLQHRVVEYFGIPTEQVKFCWTDGHYQSTQLLYPKNTKVL